MKRRLVSSFAIACCFAAAGHPATGSTGSRVAAAEEPNETFAQATLLAPGVFTTGLQSFEDGGLGVTYPDTTLGLFSDTSFATWTRRNNDDLFLGDGNGSAIRLHPVNRDGSVPLAVSGYRDLDFDGLNDNNGQPHPQSGNVQLRLSIWDNSPSADPIEEQVLDFALAPGEVKFFDEFANEDWIGHLFTAIVDNTIDGGNDVDFFRFSGLAPRALFTAEMTSDMEFQDTLLRLYDAKTGSVLAENNDAGPETYLSALRGKVSVTGDVVLAVTSYDDFEFVGAHGGSGGYTLNLSYDGDADGDGDVDGDDLAKLLRGFGTLADATRSQGDFDRDGDVDRDDLSVWRLNAGAGTLPPGTITKLPKGLGRLAGVPEPGGVGLLAIALAVLTIGYRAMRPIRRGRCRRPPK